MSIPQLIAKLSELNIKLKPVDGQLKISGPVNTLDTSIVDEIKENKQGIIKFLEDIMSRQNFNEMLQLGGKEIHYELSSAQKRIWIINHWDNHQNLHNIPTAYIVTDLSVHAFKQAIFGIVERHEILRTTFVDIQNSPRQVVHTVEELGIDLNIIEDYVVDKLQLSQIATQEANYCFNLERGPLFRATVVKVGENEHAIFLTLHHIIADGWSMQILRRDLLAFYDAVIAGDQPKLPPLKVQYKDYAVWQNKVLKSEKLKQQREYWIKQFDDGAPVLNLLYDFPRPKIKTYNGTSKQIVLDKAVTERAKLINTNREAGVFMILLASVKLLLFKYTNQTDIVVGTPIAGRNHIDLEDQIGCFINTLALRTQFDKEDTFYQLLEKVKNAVLDGYANQDYPFDELATDLKLERDLGRSPLFDVMIILQNVSWVSNTGNQSSKLLVQPYAVEIGTSLFDLTFTFQEMSGRLVLSLEYNPDLFTEATIDKMLLHYQALLDVAFTDNSCSILELEYVSESEKYHIVNTLNPGGFGDQSFISLPDIFKAQLPAHKDRCALIYNGKKIDYKGLHQLSNKIAQCLIEEYHISVGDRICVYALKSDILIATILGIVKAGGVYVPVNPENPGERISYILKDCEPTLLITNISFDKFHRLPRVKILNMEDIETKVQLYLPKEPSLVISPASVAYIIYTSGSSGRPKGVMVTHENLSSKLLAECRYYRLDETTITLQSTNIGFDVSLLEIFLPICVGGRIVVPKYQDLYSMNLLVSLAVSFGVTDLQGTPQFIKLFFQELAGKYLEEYKSVNIKRICVGGDSLTYDLVEIIHSTFPKIQINNHYGPTEITIDATILPNVRDFKSNNIGTPLDDAAVYILNEVNKLQPVGVAGELCVSGKGVSAGYWNDSLYTREKFIPSPFNNYETLYKTGDLARWTTNSSIEFLGRIDTQLKFKGYRIELEEIEHTVSRLNGVLACVVSSNMNKDELIAFVKPTATGISDVDNLQNQLADDVPYYMVPALIVEVDEIRLNTNGKIDRKYYLEAATNLTINRDTPYVKPETELETVLVDIWQQVLDRGQIGVHDNFFKLGGNSLHAVQVITRIYDTLQLSLNLKDLFLNPTINKLAFVLYEGHDTLTPLFKPLPLQQYYDCSHSQKRLWVLHQFEENKNAYNIPLVYRMRGIDMTLLQSAFHSLIERHEILRTTFVEIDGLPKQYIHDAEASWLFEIKNVDITLPKDSVERSMELARNEIHRPFDLHEGPLLRCTAFKTNEDTYLFTLVIHHIISDGWSIGVLITEVMHLYNTLLEDRERSLEPLKFQYKEFAAWQNECISSEQIQIHEDFWKNKFSNLPHPLELPSSLARPSIQQFVGDTISLELKTSIVTWIKQTAIDLNTTPYIVFLSSIKVLLYCYTKSTDIVVGSPTAGRIYRDLENQLGMYVNTLALRTELLPSDDFSQIIEKVEDTLLSADEHQIYPFDKLVEVLAVNRDLSRSPIFDIMITGQNITFREEKNWNIPGAEIKEVGLSSQVSKFDLNITFEEKDDQMYLEMEFNTSIFTRSDIDNLIQHYLELINNLQANSKVNLDKISLIPAQERELLLYQYNNTYREYPLHESIPAVFENVAGNYPNNIALIHGDIRLSFKDLNSRANQFAHVLMSKGLSKGARVGVYLNRGQYLAISMLAILKVGGVYVPLDLQNPEERTQYMINDSQCAVILTTSEHLEGTHSTFNTIHVEHIICLDDFYHGFEGERLEGSHSRETYKTLDDFPITNPNNDIKPQDWAYILYTSGSTGKPKGTILRHDGTINHILAEFEDLGLSDGFRFLQSANISSDISVWQYLAPWLKGGATVVVDQDVLLNYERLLQLVFQEEVSLVEFVPSYLVCLIDHINRYIEVSFELPKLEWIMMVGEEVPVALVNNWLSLYPGVPVVNAYGPAEASDDITQFKIYSSLSDEFSSVPIGTPLANLNIFILDDDTQLVPKGVIGEICVSGVGVGDGYWNDAKKTEECFVANNFKNTLGKTIYKTGDLGRWRNDGLLEFFGRKDRQVKIHGYRVELRELEAMLRSCEGVFNAAVDKRPDDTGEDCLVAYLILQQGYAIEGIKSHLNKQVPAYMLPDYYIQMDEFPSNLSDKIDYKRLPVPNKEQALNTTAEYEAPSRPLEKKLCELWQEILNLQQVGVLSNFFELGGHSLKATQLISRIYRELKVQVKLVDIFMYPTISSLATLIEESGITNIINIPPIPEEEHYELSYAQKRMWLMAQYDDQNTAYSISGAYLFHGLKIEILTRAVELLVDRHESLRTRFITILGEPRQKIVPNEVKIKTFDVSNAPKAEARARQIANTEINRPFNLEKDSLFRVLLIYLGADEYVLVINMHHIIADGWSEDVLMHDFWAIYGVILRNMPDPLQPLPIQYKDYTAWQKKQLSGDQLSNHHQYWLKQFKGEIPSLNLPLDRPRPKVRSFKGDSVQFYLDAQTFRDIQSINNENGVTLFMMLGAALNLLMYHYTNQEDIIIGTPAAGRISEELENQIGLYVNTLALRTRFSAQDTFSDLLRNIKSQVLDAHEHQVYPFDMLVENLNVATEQNRNPLFDVMLVLQNKQELETSATDGIKVEYFDPGESLVSQFDLLFSFNESIDSERLLFEIEYSTDCFDKSTISLMGDKLKNLFKDISTNYKNSLREFDFNYYTGDLSGGDVHFNFDL